jgi:pyruvate formate lyase activating enzyme
MADNRVRITVDGRQMLVRGGITLKQALEPCGYSFGHRFAERRAPAHCSCGGCYSCAVDVDGETHPACITPAISGQVVRTPPHARLELKRIVHGFNRHRAAGVGTPWSIASQRRSVETACFAAGCNLRCPQCQNWDIATCSTGDPITPHEAARRLSEARLRIGVDRMAISGGECTLNRPWLVRFIRELKKMNPDSGVRIHIDTNATLLSPDYVDELVQAGVTDVGADLKGYFPETFLRISGLQDIELAESYLATAWNAVRRLAGLHRDRVFTGVGIPYNRQLISARELAFIGEELSEMDPDIQVTVLDYRPEYKRLDLLRPSAAEMRQARDLLRTKGLRRVICQTAGGCIGPE